MKYSEMKRFLLSEFNKNDFRELIKQGEKLSKSLILAKLENKTFYSVQYPGYKAKIRGNKTYYDYRVDIEKNNIKVPLSHVNIIVDLYHKIFKKPLLKNDLLRMLGNIYQEGEIDPLFNTKSLQDYQAINVPSKSTIKGLEKIHKEIGKTYNSAGNQWDLEIQELYTGIVWIALQEEINYPHELGYEGRKMPFYRYIEAVQYSADKKPITPIIQRALVHYRRPVPLDDVDYSILE